MTSILDFIAEWSVRIIGTVGLVLLAGWLVETLLNAFYRRYEWGKVLYEFYQWRRSQKKRTKAVRVEVPDQRRPLD